jgi:hypothetical protein
MKKIESSQETINLSVEKVVDLIRQLRNQLVKDFLIEDNVRTYFQKEYQRALSDIKLEFLKRDLKELLISPVDLSHYSSLIKQIRESNSASLAEGNQELFYKEIERIFKKYNY